MNHQYAPYITNFTVSEKFNAFVLNNHRAISKHIFSYFIYTPSKTLINTGNVISVHCIQTFPEYQGCFLAVSFNQIEVYLYNMYDMQIIIDVNPGLKTVDFKTYILSKQQYTSIITRRYTHFQDIQILYNTYLYGLL